MSRPPAKALQAIDYERAAQEYGRRTSPAYFTVATAETTAQAGQREITLASLALVKYRRTDLHVFNELLVEYPVRGGPDPEQVVPDNMAVLSAEPPRAVRTFDVSRETAPPFWVLNYAGGEPDRKTTRPAFARASAG